jgi:nitrate/nitrite transport system substrate-binding protein
MFTISSCIADGSSRPEKRFATRRKRSCHVLDTPVSRARHAGDTASTRPLRTVGIDEVTQPKEAVVQKPDGTCSGTGLTRRDVLKRGSALATAAAVPSLLSARPARSATSAKTIKIGFIALTDCSSVVMAHELGFYKARGLDVQLIKQASWPATRDALINGDIDAAHGLFSLPLSVATGIGGAAGTNKIKIAMMLNQNGQAITLKKEFASAGYGNLKAAKAAIKGGDGQTFAMTFPGGTHDTWLRYWLLAMGVSMSTPKIIPIPPPQMVANMQVGNMDGYCVGEPWGGVAAQKGIGFTAIATQDIWKHHPEKALIVNADFAAGRTPELKKVMGAILEASKWLDFAWNRAKTSDTVGRPEYVNAPSQVIEDRLNGKYDLGAGLGQKKFLGDQMRFCRGGQVNLPRKSHAIWFMAQYVRFGLLKSEPNYNAIAKELILTDLYKEVAAAEKLAVPNDDMAPFQVKLDKVTFDPKKPSKEAKRK